LGQLNLGKSPKIDTRKNGGNRKKGGKRGMRERGGEGWGACSTFRHPPGTHPKNPVGFIG